MDKMLANFELVKRSNPERLRLMFMSVGSAVLYGFTSVSMAFLNKLVLDYFNYDFPLVIMTLQMAVTYIIVATLDKLGYIHLSKLTRSNLIRFLAPCMFYSLNGVLSLVALGSMNLTMYSLIKRNGPLCTMILTTIILKKGIPGRYVITGVLMMSLGCIIAAKGDLSFEVEPYLYGAGSVLSQSLYLIFLQRLSDNYTTSDTLYMNSVLSFPVLAVLTVLFGEFHRAQHYAQYTSPAFIVALLILLVMGSFLNFTLFLCNSNNSALTTSVVGTLKSVAQTTMGMFTFGGVDINAAMLSGVAINMSGGILYTAAKYHEGQKKAQDMKRVESELTLLNVENGKITDQQLPMIAEASNLTQVHSTPSRGDSDTERSIK